LKQEYIRIDQEISIIKNDISVLSREKIAVQTRMKEIEVRSEQIQALKSRVEELKAQRREMGILRSKKDIDRQISAAENSCAKAENYFKQAYKTSAKDAKNEVKRLEATVKKIEHENAQLQAKLPSMIADKEDSKIEYQRQKLLADIDRDKEKIAERLRKLENETMRNQSSIKRGVNLRRNEKEIDEISDEDFLKILKDTDRELKELFIKRREIENKVKMELEQQREKLLEHYYAVFD